MKPLAALTQDEIRQRFPRLITLLRVTAILTQTEAVSAIQGYRQDGLSAVGSEAVMHFGGIAKLVLAARQHRRYFGIR
ncbi:hypothetical protein [Parachitinimonas caeni]|uniref:Uncharacterized protein n=1 Tax=Parachitinimonas caeni TaxID=3031301 RepID=A0ABT7E377_9NEIS|nr:hypothetical protein [Parachitinimonas caeni]MDK2126765.1 hypothetical protein [Parachitinimonas caeni]